MFLSFFILKTHVFCLVSETFLCILEALFWIFVAMQILNEKKKHPNWHKLHLADQIYLLTVYKS